MNTIKSWVAAAGAVTVLATGAACGGGGDSQKAKPASTDTSAPASEANVAPTSSEVAAHVQQMMATITSQLAQATNDGGAPRALTHEEVEALLRSQMQNLGISR